MLASPPYILYFFLLRYIPRNEIYWAKVDECDGWILTRLLIVCPILSSETLSSERNKCSLLLDKLRNVFISVRKTQDSVWERSWRSTATSQRWVQYYLVTKFWKWAHLECGPGGSLVGGGIHTESLAPKLRRNGRVFLLSSCSESQGWAPQCHPLGGGRSGQSLWEGAAGAISLLETILWSSWI